MLRGEQSESVLRALKTGMNLVDLSVEMVVEKATAVVQFSGQVLDPLGWGDAAQTIVEVLELEGLLLEVGSQGSVEAVCEFVDSLHAEFQKPFGLSPVQSPRQFGHGSAFVLQSGCKAAVQEVRELFQKPANRPSPFGDQFCGGAGGRGTQVGHEVADGKVDFVSYSRDDRQVGFKNGTGYDFFVERPQVFEASSASGDDDGLELLGGGLHSGPAI